MGKEINLLEKYPKSKRNLNERNQKKTQENILTARSFGKEFFDGTRDTGYGGFTYNPKFWSEVVKTFQNYWNLNKDSKLLDVGCAKGFMLYDFHKLIPGINFKGIDISEYAIINSISHVKHNLLVADAANLPFHNAEFDYSISINTVHNLELDQCINALKEIDRVSRLGSFITVDAYRTDEEKKRMYQWNLTAKTIMSVNEWKILFKKINFKGDFYWFIP